MPVKLDIDQDESVQACGAQVLKEAGVIDVLVNNAGVEMARVALRRSPSGSVSQEGFSNGDLYISSHLPFRTKGKFRDEIGGGQNRGFQHLKALSLKNSRFRPPKPRSRPPKALSQKMAARVTG